LDSSISFNAVRAVGDVGYNCATQVSYEIIKFFVCKIFWRVSLYILSYSFFSIIETCNISYSLIYMSYGSFDTF